MLNRLRPAGQELRAPVAWTGAGRRGGQTGVYLLAAGVGLALGLVAFVAGSAPSARVAGIIVLAAAFPFAAIGVGSLQRALFGLLILDTPLQWDINLGYRADVAELGALGGLNLSLTTLALAGLYALWAAESLTRRDEGASGRLRLALPFAVYVLISGLSILVAADPTLALYGVVLLAQTLLVFVYVAAKVRSDEDVRFVVTLLLAGLLIEAVAIIAIGDAELLRAESSFEPRGDANEWTGPLGPRPTGTIGSPNGAGSFLALLLPVAAGALAARLPRWTKMLAAAGLISGLAALVLTFSRGAWISATLALVLFLMLGGRRGVVRPSVTAATLVVIAVIATPLYGAIGARLTGDDKGAAEGRLPLMELAAKIIVDKPALGVGANNFATVIPQYAGPEFSRDWEYTVHNQYLLVAAETGLVALVALLVFLASMIRRGYRCARVSDPLVAPVALGLTCALIGHLFHMAVDLFSSRPQVQALWLLLGLLAALYAISFPTDSPSGHTWRRSPSY